MTNLSRYANEQKPGLGIISSIINYLTASQARMTLKYFDGLGVTYKNDYQHNENFMKL